MVTAPTSRPPMEAGVPRATISCAEEHGHTVGQRLHLVHVVGGEQHGRSPGGQAADELPGVTPPRGVEAGRGLVEEQELGVPDDAEAHVQPALLAAGESS